MDIRLERKGILSYEVKMIKPMPEIYRLLLERYALKPEECVFLDDSEENIEGARRAGIQTVLFKDRCQAGQELEKLGVK